MFCINETQYFSLLYLYSKTQLQQLNTINGIAESILTEKIGGFITMYSFKYEKGSKFHEGTKLYEDKFARRVNFAQRYFCTKKNLNEDTNLQEETNSHEDNFARKI